MPGLRPCRSVIRRLCGPNHSPDDLGMTTLAMNLRDYQERAVGYGPAFARITFGAFIGSLVLLLILSYAGVPIVSGV